MTVLFGKGIIRSLHCIIICAFW